MKRKKRTYNVRLIRQKRSYSIQEIAELYGLHKNVISRWIKDGLPIIDHHKPYLIYGADLSAYLSKRRARRKCKCGPDEFYCCKCRLPRRVWENVVDVVFQNESKLRISALCAVCNTQIYRIGSVNKLAQYQKTFIVQTTQGQHIVDRASTVVMCDNKGE